MAKGLKNRVFAASMALLMAASLTPASVYSNAFATTVIAAEADVEFGTVTDNIAIGTVLYSKDGVVVKSTRKAPKYNNGYLVPNSNNDVTVSGKTARSIAVITVAEPISVTVSNTIASGKMLCVLASDEELATDAAGSSTVAEAPMSGWISESGDYTFEAVPGKFYYICNQGTGSNVFTGIKCEKVVKQDVTFTLANSNANADVFAKVAITVTDKTTKDTFVISNPDKLAATLKVGHAYSLKSSDGRIVPKVGDSMEFTAEDGKTAITVDCYDEALKTVKGAVTGTGSKEVEKITFTEVGNATNAVDAVIDGESYTASLAVGEYETTVTMKGDKAIVPLTKDTKVVDHVSVKIGETEVSNEVYIELAEAASPIEFKKEITVPGDYATLTAALKAIGNMTRPEAEAGRVTIKLTADLQEQVSMNQPYVTLNGDGHTLSWYYGIQTKYYSVDANGYYNEGLARDKYNSNEANATIWGGVMIVNADNFIAENTTFKNTYNYELTEAEKTDIAGGSLGTKRLAEGADVTAYSFKERSNAFAIQGDKIEVYNCKILSSQDTLGINGTPKRDGKNLDCHVYFKDCVIGGNTDYICGLFSAIFDNCELQWKTFKDDEANNVKVGYIIAAKESPYVFRDCKVTRDIEANTMTMGQYGRTWSSAKPGSQAIFLNTETNGMVNLDTAWVKMTGELKDARYYDVYNKVNGDLAKSCVEAAPEIIAANYDTAGDNVASKILTFIPTKYEAKTAPDYKTFTVKVAEAKDGKVEVDKTSALAGKEITVTATPNDGFVVDKITVKDEAGNEVKMGKEKFAMPEANVTVTVTFKAAEKLTDVTVTYEKGFLTSETYGDKAVVTFTVGEDMPNKELEDATKPYAQGSKNPNPGKGAVPTEGAFVKITAVKDTTIKFVMNSTEKVYYLVCEDGSEEAKTGAKIEENMSFNLTAGKTYYYYAQGSKLMIKSVTYQSLSADKPATGANEWKEENGVKFWYENGVKQGTEGRGKEIYDPASDAWYFLDAVDGGKMATGKDVAQPTDWEAYNKDPEGYGLDNSKWKWVRYDAEGKMIKGWNENENGKYYFDEITGQMAKGSVEVGNQALYFDEVTGIAADKTWITLNGVEFWYEGGVRQGYEKGNEAYRGKEIYDPKADAWFWLDNVDGGKKAVAKDVYQESLAGDWGDIDKDGVKYGKWVRYDENGKMIKGWSADGNYYFDPMYGTMAKGTAVIDGKTYNFDPATGILVK